MKIWITADWHFNHRGINRATSHWTTSEPNRDFPDMDSMNNHIIDRINDLVKPEDTLWNLGDVIFGNARELPSLMAKINCRDIRLILGNHDKGITGKNRDCFSWIGTEKRLRHGEYRIYMHHIPWHTWPAINKGTMMLHGHCHGNLPDRGIRQMDVGVDNNGNLEPYLLDDIVDILAARPYENCPDIPQDHHTK